MGKTISDFEGHIINAQIKELKTLFKKRETFEKGKSRFLEFHSSLFPGEMTGQSGKTFEDFLWDDLTEDILRKATTSKGRTILYGLWHSSRIEDMTLNTLVNRKEQIYFSGGYSLKINAGIDHTGNSLSPEEILKLSGQLDIGQLRNYRMAVGKSTREILISLSFDDLKRKVLPDDIGLLRVNRSVDDVPEANWLLDFWGKKNVEGIFFMPACRHQCVHLRESFEAKRRGLAVKAK